eukprot:1195806-Prorocentrum_minimum.AAC.6
MIKHAAVCLCTEGYLSSFLGAGDVSMLSLWGVVSTARRITFIAMGGPENIAQHAEHTRNCSRHMYRCLKRSIFYHAQHTPEHTRFYTKYGRQDFSFVFVRLRTL